MSNDETDKDRCGHPTDSGHPCKRPAGWGRDTDEGYCADHADEVRTPSRNSKLTHKRQESIASMLEDGHSINAACRANAITKQTHRRWMNKGEEQEEGIYCDYYNRATRARGVGEYQFVEQTKNIAIQKEDARTLFNMIKSQYPESWAPERLPDEADADEENPGVNLVFQNAEAVERPDESEDVEAQDTN